jgi:hypothetical protein
LWYCPNFWERVGSLSRRIYIFYFLAPYIKKHDHANKISIALSLMEIITKLNGTLGTVRFFRKWSFVPWILPQMFFKKHLILGHFDRSRWCFRFGWKYKGFSKFIKGNNWQHVFYYLFLNNCLAQIRWMGVIAEVQTVV